MGAVTLNDFSTEGFVVEDFICLKDRFAEGYIVDDLLEPCRDHIHVQIERIDRPSPALSITIGCRYMEVIQIIINRNLPPSRLPRPLSSLILLPDFLSKRIANKRVVPTFVSSKGRLDRLNLNLLNIRTCNPLIHIICLLCQAFEKVPHLLCPIPHLLVGVGVEPFHKCFRVHTIALCKDS